MSKDIPLPDSIREALDAMADSAVMADNSVGPGSIDSFVNGFISNLEGQLALGDDAHDADLLASAEAQLQHLLMEKFKQSYSAAGIRAKSNVRRAQDDDPEKDEKDIEIPDLGETPSTLVTGLERSGPLQAPSHDHIHS